MKRFFAFSTAVLACSILASCGGGDGLGKHGSSEPAPTNVQIRAEDSRVLLTWDMQPGVEYWVYKAQGSGVTPQNCSSMLACETFINVTSPFETFGQKYLLQDGIIYSFSINARSDGGPGGPGSPSLDGIPQIAGVNWLTNNAFGTQNLRSVAFGVSYLQSPDDPTNPNARVATPVYIAVGDAGTILQGQETGNGLAWAFLNNPTSTNYRLNGVVYNSTKAMYMAVGDNGTILDSLDGVKWDQESSGTLQNLNSITVDSNGYFVAVGARGTVLISQDGINWNSASVVPTTNTLYSVAFGSLDAGSVFQAVGDNGTILYSADGNTWTQTNPSTNGTLTRNALRSVAFSSGGSFVAVGDNKTVLISTDGITWVDESTLTTSNMQSTIQPTNLNAIAFGKMFIIGGDDGNIYYSPDGVTWGKTTVPYTSLPIYAIAPGSGWVRGPGGSITIYSSTVGVFDYSAVGANGLNLYSD
ncbi:MAG: hypothetical protein LBG66_05070 [Gallionellaceae bacterium]|jgi:hypothetical protein|nr:hypothetical protein [Gallionellaceae bacterium]